MKGNKGGGQPELPKGTVRGPFTIIKPTGETVIAGGHSSRVYLVRCQCGRRSKRNSVVLAVSHAQGQGGCKWCWTGKTYGGLRGPYTADEDRNGRVAWMARHGVSDQQTIGDIFGISKQRVKQIEKAVYTAGEGRELDGE